MARLGTMSLVVWMALLGAGRLSAQEDGSAPAPAETGSQEKESPAPAESDSVEKEPSAPELIAKGLKWWETVETLRATFTRRERLADMTDLGEKQVIFLRERKNPFSIYMQWVEGPAKGRRVTYTEGKNGGKLKATPGGPLGWLTVDIVPDSAEALKYSRHTVLEAGLGRMMAGLARQFKIAAPDVRSKYKGKTTYAGRPCYKFFRYMPQKPQYYCWKVELLIDEEFNYPAYLKCYDWERNAFEEYSYTDVEINPKYTDKHFDLRTGKE